MSATATGGAIVLAGSLPKLVMAALSATEKSFQLGGDLEVNRLGFGAMRITGAGIWGWPPDRENAKKVLRRAIELGVNLNSTGFGLTAQPIDEANAPSANNLHRDCHHTLRWLISFSSR